MDLIQKIIDAYGGVKSVQDQFEYSSPMAIYQWRCRGIPSKAVVPIHLKTGIPLDELQAGTYEALQAKKKIKRAA